ncbi:MAG TPA: hypothetical protein DG355_03240 [Candidatus Cloacimonas sp.]|nr:hypothetical protein [Candidatus Cloacimonas sp.]
MHAITVSTAIGAKTLFRKQAIMQLRAGMNMDLCPVDQCLSYDTCDGARYLAPEYSIMPDKKMLDLKDKLRIFT